ncbi:hypothetical protein SteCoe_21648 [Stentor coeruleus]|uniref:Uncharacterized protein n=1 Tax=Stentor coeruleus TaxID=5963 RepID=A0A1R2BPI9_9CILI|nr:hypothetical protein SteCoe_21648 [Stentor coeruleus]
MVKRNLRKTKLWAHEEDSALKDIIKKFNSKSWVTIARKVSKEIGTKRTAKQCRDRWINYLNKGINNRSFTDYEVNKLISIQEVHGNKWIDMAKELKGRTENQVKNFFHATIRRNIRKFNKGKNDCEKIEFISMEMLNNPEVRSILLAKKNVPWTVISNTKLSVDALYFLQSLKNPKNETTYDLSKSIIYNGNSINPYEPWAENEEMIKSIYNVYQYCTEFLLPSYDIQNPFLF